MTLYEEVTADIVKQLEAGVKPWAKSWKSRSIIPYNAVKGVHYRGVNIVCLWSAAIRKGFSANAWLGFQEARALGGSVRRGERATRGLYVNFIEDEETKAKRAFAKVFHVFNIEQVDGLPKEYAGAAPEPLPPGALTDIVSRSGIRVKYGPAPCYKLGPDLVEMPNRSDFTTDTAEADYASTLCHELSHATGAPSRLNRDMTKEGYAREELIAELSSAFLCSHLGVSYNDAASPAYIEHWLKVLKEDHKALFQIASQASKAADWLRDGPKEAASNPEMAEAAE